MTKSLSIATWNFRNATSRKLECTARLLFALAFDLLIWALCFDGIYVAPDVWRVPNPPGANPLVAERAFPTSDYWGRTGVASCAEEMTGICRDFQ